MIFPIRWDLCQPLAYIGSQMSHILGFRIKAMSFFSNTKGQVNSEKKIRCLKFSKNATKMLHSSAKFKNKQIDNI